MRHRRAYLVAIVLLSLCVSSSWAGGLRSNAQKDELYSRQVNDFIYAWEDRNLELARKRFEIFAGDLISNKDPGLAVLGGWLYYELKQYDRAERWFQLALDWDPKFTDAEYGIALTHFQRKQFDKAESYIDRNAADEKSIGLLADIYFARAVEARDQGEYQRSLDYLREAEDIGKSDRAINLLSAWNYFDLGNNPKAAPLFLQSYHQQPDDESALGVVLSHVKERRWNQLMRLARNEGGPLEAQMRAAEADFFYQRKLFIASNAIDSKRFSHLENVDASNLYIGVGYRSKSGDDGTSELEITALPMFGVSTVFADRHVFSFNASKIDLDSGSLDPGRLIGSEPLGASFIQSPTTELNSGYELTLDYRHEDWMTPYANIGLALNKGEVSSNVFGRIGIVQQFGAGRLQLELFSQPVRESILSYTGIDDPYTGENFGRVVRSGGGVSGIYSLWSDWTLSSSASWASYKGNDTEDNSRVFLALGVSKDLGVDGFDYFSLGPEISYESFDENLSQFTFGHGGYFSPQRLVNAGLGLNFLSDEGQRYIFKGRVYLGYSDRHESAVSCFPNGGVVGPVNPACNVGFASNNESELNYSGELHGVYRINENWQLGGGVVVRQTPDFDDVAGMLFFRHWFESRSSVVSSDLAVSVMESLF